MQLSVWYSVFSNTPHTMRVENTHSNSLSRVGSRTFIKNGDIMVKVPLEMTFYHVPNATVTCVVHIPNCDSGG